MTMSLSSTEPDAQNFDDNRDQQCTFLKAGPTYMLDKSVCDEKKKIAVVCQTNLDREPADTGECVSGKQDLFPPIEKAV